MAFLGGARKGRGSQHQIFLLHEVITNHKGRLRPFLSQPFPMSFPPPPPHPPLPPPPPTPSGPAAPAAKNKPVPKFRTKVGTVRTIGPAPEKPLDLSGQSSRTTLKVWKCSLSQEGHLDQWQQRGEEKITGKTVAPDRLKVLTWNLDTSKIHMELRMKALLELMMAHRPHILCLQEVFYDR
eukprot:g64563.t1